MDLLVIALAVLCLPGFRFCRRGFFEDPLSVTATGALRGILAVLVVLGHLYKDADSGMLHLLLSNVGTLCVVIFFFLSGYGLQKSFESKPGYGKTILKRRIPGIGKTFLLLVPFYWALYTFIGRPYTPVQVLLSMVNGDPVVRYGWYTVCQILLYLVFFLGTQLKRKMPLVVLAGSVLLMAAAKLAQLPPYWYYSVPAFPLGVLWAAEEKKLEPKLKKHWLPVLAVSFAGFGLGFAGGLLTYRAPFYWLISCTLPVVVVQILQKVRFDNPCLRFLGGLSFEIYSLHGFFMLLLRSDLIYIGSDLLWGSAVLAATIPAAYLLNRILKMK